MAQTLERENPEQQLLEPEVDRDFGVSHDINDERANADNLPAPIDAGNATLPASYEQAKLALAACESIDECKDWEDRAAALAAYGRMAGDTDLEKYALRIRARAAQRTGELLREIPAETGGRPRRKKNSGGRSSEFSDASLEPSEKTMSPRAAAAKAAGMSEHQVKEAMRVATVPKEEFDRQVNGPKPPSVAKLAKQGTRRRPLPSAKPDNNKNRCIGAEAIERALKRWRADATPAEQDQIEANTRKRRACVNALKSLPRQDAAWASEVASRVKREVLKDREGLLTD
jgi:hypothetical protein